MDFAWCFRLLLKMQCCSTVLLRNLYENHHASKETSEKKFINYYIKSKWLTHPNSYGSVVKWVSTACKVEFWHVVSRQLLLSELGCFKRISLLELSVNLHLAPKLMARAELQVLAGSGALGADGERNRLPCTSRQCHGEGDRGQWWNIPCKKSMWLESTSFLADMLLEGWRIWLERDMKWASSQGSTRNARSLRATFERFDLSNLCWMPVHLSKPHYDLKSRSIYLITANNSLHFT